MAGYSTIERSLARFLDGAPGLKRLLKRLYHVTNYIAFRERNFVLEVAPAAIFEELGATSAKGKERFFGYFDKSPWEPSGRSMLLHQLQPNGSLSIRLHRGQGEVEVARSSSWSWQQAAMGQWALSGQSHLVVFNAVRDGKLASVWCDPETSSQRVLNWPVQAIEPAGNSFISLNYRRLALLRPDYGYAIPVANFQPNMPDKDDGLWMVDSHSGEARLVVSLDKLRTTEPTEDIREATQHKVNHVLFSPSGNRFVFVYRWFGSSGKKSRLFLYTPETDELRLLMDDGMVSHYCWRNDTELIVYGRQASVGDHYYLLNVESLNMEAIAPGVLDKYGDGHPSVSPCGQYLLTDTYPDRRRQQRVLVYKFGSSEVIELGRFLLPLKFDGICRVDLHPRWSPDGIRICIDSGHEGRRGVYILEIGKVLANG